ncbi:aminotransferase [Megasphaera cerevisiae DSM 20462]|jgi:DNA-binding transcriptional MocR family regulator|uniref:Aminotransferase n=1 Tax=Megasphaera cerevisiae DSM 20462 TaxID=1122219 RepID=A0A0J6WUR2_9FIRM|nr:PLP-dependent aminotransferase family protein [Megasphaera cerevisiae]KMO86284.1 aminotransferase [Megasphaera cerevisiae DSM 20462]MCI1751128.1 PLP-dependent aminotransferase family protein [Megasphaera cerevisiae]OKY53179.1 aminotransferase [Megasphaera cerevisiae]SJZ44991.1 2-aminoadipate transaminase [Megasphaera cerevisiae DSM 20462]
MTRFSSFAQTLKASDIAALLALTEQPEVISFAGGLPAPELFPIEEMKKVDEAIYNEEGRKAVQYGTTEGYVPLREEICRRMKDKFFVDCKPDDVVVTTGSQQALFILSQILVDKDQMILMESPSYMGAIMAFNPVGPKYTEVPTDDKGIVPEELEKILAADDTIRMIYVIPEFQNPTGITWPVERRRAFMDIINKYDVIVLEDDPYGEIRYDIEKLPSLKSMDTQNKVVFLGSFSKIFMPGLRLGWIVANPEIIDKFVKFKQAVDLGTSTFGQRQAAYYCRMYDMEAHIQKITALYAKRRDLMYQSMETYFPEGITFTYPQGGLFTWVTLPEQLDATELMPKCLAKNVAYVPGNIFYPNGGHRNHFRLNYSNMPEERIVEGIKRLGDVLKEALAK